MKVVVKEEVFSVVEFNFLRTGSLIPGLPTTGWLIITVSKSKPCQQPVLGIKIIPRTCSCTQVESHHWV